MPKKAAELSAIRVRDIRQPGMHFVGGVAGLALQVLPSGGRSWVLRVRIGGKRRDMGLGGFPDVPLAQAREAARRARDKIKNGIDPIEEARQAREVLRRAVQNAITFQDVAETYIDQQAPGWKNPKSAAQWRASLKAYAYPLIGSKYVRDITVQDVLAVVEPIWTTKTETASRVRQRMDKILGAAIARGYRPHPNPAAWDDNLENILPARGRVIKKQKQPSLPYTQIGEFMAELRKREGDGAAALEFAILCASRSGEVRGATWQEIDWNERTFTIPSERMKMDREHRVPLSTAALAVLERQWEAACAESPHGKPDPKTLIFPSASGTEVSDATLNAVIKRMNEGVAKWLDKDGRAAVQHGFRSTFATWRQDRTNFPEELGEIALAHSKDDKSAAAYQRGEMLEKRRKLMQAWADYCSKIERPAKVVEFGKRKEAA
ncbi:MAG: tyrosine-type recombinase/integrase [Burkholderiales bacterium]|jgi:integrase|nr:tyrosine-type recombinase/integrase [Burkholderiales bacterium]